MEQSKEKNIDLEENSQKKTKEEESDYNVEYYDKKYSKNYPDTTLKTVIEKKNEKELNQKLKNINRGRVLLLMNKIQNLDLRPYSKRRRLVLFSRKKSLKIRRLSIPKRKRRVKRFPKQREDFLQIKEDSKKIYDTCLNYYSNNESIERECDICNNKNGNSNEYIRFENILQCYQFLFYLIYEKNFLFKKVCSSGFLFELKMNLKSEIMIQKNYFNNTNVRTICKCCFLKFIYSPYIINLIKAVFQLNLDKKKDEIKKNNKECNLSFLFKIVKVE